MNLIPPSVSLPSTGAKMLGIPMKGKILTFPSSSPPDLIRGKPSASLKRLEMSTAYCLKRLRRNFLHLSYIFNSASEDMTKTRSIDRVRRGNHHKRGCKDLGYNTIFPTNINQ